MLLQWIGLGVAVALIIALFVITLVKFVIKATAPMVDDVETFLQLLGQEKIQEAYLSTTSEFKKQWNAEEFQETVKDKKLDQYVSFSWNKRKMAIHSGLVNGTVHTKRDKVFIRLEMIKEDEKWKISALSF